MEQQRIPDERGRWLSALLIVTAIMGTTAGVRFWPAAPRPPAPALAVRSLPIHAAEVQPERAPRTDVRPLPTARVAAAARTRAPRGSWAPPREAATAPTARVAPDVAAAPATPAEAAGGEPLDLELASRALRVTPGAGPALAVPGPAEPVGEATAAAIAPAGFPYVDAEVPAVAVARAVTVAGRGIVSGVRATGAAIRAAF